MVIRKRKWTLITKEEEEEEEQLLPTAALQNCDAQAWAKVRSQLRKAAGS